MPRACGGRGRHGGAPCGFLCQSHKNRYRRVRTLWTNLSSSPRRRSARAAESSFQAMTRAHRISNLVAVVLPFLAFLAAIVLLWNKAVGWTDLAIFAVHVRDHRLRHHDRLPPAVHPPRVRDLDAGAHGAGDHAARWRSRATSSRGSPTTASTTRSPTRKAIRTARTSHAEDGLVGALKGLWHAHVGWMLATTHARPRLRAPLRARPARATARSAGSTARSSSGSALTLLAPVRCSASC